MNVETASKANRNTVHLGKYRSMEEQTVARAGAISPDGSFMTVLNRLQESQSDRTTTIAATQQGGGLRGFYRAFGVDPLPGSLGASMEARTVDTKVLEAVAQAGPTASSKSDPMNIADYPRPVGDNGRGMHWVPTTSSSPEVVDRFVAEAVSMKVKWVTILNDGTDALKNDYLVQKLVENGIEPIMRVYTPNGQAIKGDLAGLVRHYKAMGVDYFQLYNEPNNTGENPTGVPDVGSFVTKWVSAAKIVSENGGLPGLAPMSPGGNVDDIRFLKESLQEIRDRGELGVLDKAWVAIHNYTFNRPVDYEADSNGFLKFRWYDEIVREITGRSLPIIGTEGGTQLGNDHDKNYPAVDENRQAELLADAYRYMQQAESYFFAYSPWVIANEAGGGMDSSFSGHALFGLNGPVKAVEALKVLV